MTKWGELQDIYERLKDEVYKELDPPQRGTIFDAKIPVELLEELEEKLTEIDDVIDSKLIKELLDMIEYGSDIEKLSSYDVHQEKQSIFDSKEDEWDVDKRDSDAQYEAEQEEERLYEEATDKVKSLVDDLLPSLLGY